jgi:Uma2 family endonuclease
VNLRDRRVEVHTEPASGEYRRVTVFERGERIRLVAFPEFEFAVSDFLR